MVGMSSAPNANTGSTEGETTDLAETRFSALALAAGPARAESVPMIEAHRTMRVVTVAIADLTPDPANARVHPERNIDSIKASLTAFGLKKPIVVQEDGMIIRAGNGTVEAAKALGWTHIDAHVTAMTNTESIAYSIADNRSAEQAEWDLEALGRQIEGLKLDGFDLDAIGFTEEEIGDMLADSWPDELEEDTVPEIPENPTAKPGQLWSLGNHRVLCGDATKADVWDRLRIPDRSACFTSPPYNLGASSKLSGNKAQEIRGNTYVGHDDQMSEDDYRTFIDAMLTCALGRCAGVVFNVQPLAGSKRALMRWLGSRADHLCDIVTWDKGHAAPQMAQGVMSSTYEWLAIFAPEPDASRRVPLSSWKGNIQSVYRGPKQTGNEYAEIHGATFPIHLPAFVISELMNRCASVVDCCMGTGTTLIAAEQLGRSCFGIEIDPRYVDVIISRWENLTGQTAELLEIQA